MWDLPYPVISPMFPSYAILGRAYVGNRKPFLLTSTVCPSSFVHFCSSTPHLLEQCAGTLLLETWTSTKAHSSMNNGLSQHFPGISGLRFIDECQDQGWSVNSQCVGGQDCSGSLNIWCCIPTDPSKISLSVNCCQIFIFGGQTRDILCHHDADVTYSF